MARSTVAALAVAVALGGFAATRAQTQTPPGDILPALLAEVRGLRAAIEQMAAAGAQVQLALGRLQLQEQRVNAAIRRHEEAAARLGQFQQEAAMHQDQLTHVTAALERPLPDEERRQMEEILEQHRQQVARFATHIQQATSDEASLAGAVDLEQARWTELNRRLEDLERALGQR